MKMIQNLSFFFFFFPPQKTSEHDLQTRKQIKFFQMYCYMEKLGLLFPASGMKRDHLFMTFTGSAVSGAA